MTDPASGGQDLAYQMPRTPEKKVRRRGGVGEREEGGTVMIALLSGPPR
jgi:hypothetical protein